MESSSLSQVQRYQQGWLAWWVSERECNQGKKPKGYVCLLRIARVHHERSGYDGRGVVVKHKKGSHEDCVDEELLLLLPDRTAAQEWSYNLWEFLSKMRGEWNESR